MHKEATFRLGCRTVGKPEEGAEELKAHSFFTQGDPKTGREPMPWKKMEAGKVNYLKDNISRRKLFNCYFQLAFYERASAKVYMGN